MPRQGETFAVCENPQLFYGFSGYLYVLGAGEDACLTGCAVKEPLLGNSFDAVFIAVAGIECEPHLLAHVSRSRKIGYLKGGTDRDTAEALDTVAQRFHLRGLLL